MPDGHCRGKTTERPTQQQVGGRRLMNSGDKSGMTRKPNPKCFWAVEINNFGDIALLSNLCKMGSGLNPFRTHYYCAWMAFATTNNNSVMASLSKWHLFFIGLYSWPPTAPLSVFLTAHQSGHTNQKIEWHSLKGLGISTFHLAVPFLVERPWVSDDDEEEEEDILLLLPIVAIRAANEVECEISVSESFHLLPMQF
jgi:hypothetical protein